MLYYSNINVKNKKAILEDYANFSKEKRRWYLSTPKILNPLKSLYIFLYLFFRIICISNFRLPGTVLQGRLHLSWRLNLLVSGLSFTPETYYRTNARDSNPHCQPLF